MLTLKLVDCIYLRCMVQSTHCCQEFDQWKQLAQELQEESSSIPPEKSSPLLLTSSTYQMALHSTYQVEECPAEVKRSTENRPFLKISTRPFRLIISSLNENSFKEHKDDDIQPNKKMTNQKNGYHNHYFLTNEAMSTHKFWKFLPATVLCEKEIAQHN